MIATCRTLSAVCAFMVFAAAAQAQEDKAKAKLPETPDVKSPKSEEKTPDADGQRDQQEDDPFAQEPSAGQEASQAFNPHMVGDFPGFFLLRIAGPERQGSPLGVNSIIPVPLASRGPIKIAENESPRPVDRIFAFYRSFNNLQGAGVPDAPGLGTPSFDLAEKVVGFEKTFLAGDASIGIRLPFYDLGGPIGSSGSGDIGMILKLALINDRLTGNVFSTGLMLTLPTGDLPLGVPLDFHPTLYQPWVGYIINWNGWFLQGFSSIVISDDSRDINLAFNDIGLGYLLYRAAPDRFISALVPTLEAHITNPLGSSRPNDLVDAIDLVVLTAGIHIQMYGQATLTLAGATPVAGGDVFDFESILQFNLPF